MSRFARTTCACRQCVNCCKRQPGPLAPGDMERIAVHVGKTVEEVKPFFWASGGAVVKQGDRLFRVGTITPKMRGGRCVFLDESDRCSIHVVAPFGCAQFDTHMPRAEAERRGVWLVKLTQSEEYQELRRSLPFAESYRPTAY